MLTVARYIEGNPVRAKLVKSTKDWRWSSHAERGKEAKNPLTGDLPIELPDNWAKYVDTPKRIETIAVRSRTVGI